MKKLLMMGLLLVAPFVAVMNAQQLSFTGANLESGTSNSEGAVYRFSNVDTGVDALVKVVSFNDGAGLVEIDNSELGLGDAFQPTLQTANNADSSVDFEISFVEAGTTTPKSISFNATAADVDGDGSSVKEYISLSSPISYMLENPTRLTVGSDDIGLYVIPQNVDNVSGITVTETRNIITASYVNVTKISYRIGAKDAYTQPRYNSLYFKDVVYTDATVTESTPTPVAFECTSNAFLDYGIGDYRTGDQNITSINLSDGTVGSPMAISAGGVTSIGFNTLDNMLWGYNFGSNAIVRIDASGIQKAFTVASLPDREYAGADVGLNGMLYLSTFNIENSGLDKIEKVDVSTGTPTYKGFIQLNRTIKTADIAINPKDNMLYFVNSSGMIQRINLDATSANVNDVNDTNLGSLNVIMCFFDVDGNYYFKDSTSSTIHKASWNDSLKNFSSIAPYSSLTENFTAGDGARCALAAQPEAVMTPFTCDDTMYFSNMYDLTSDTQTNGTMYLHSINREQSPFTFSKIGEGYHVEGSYSNSYYNALAFNPEDNFLYATVKNRLLKIDKNGVIQELGVIEDLPAEQHFAATFGRVEADGTAYYYLTQMHNKEIYKIDVKTKTIKETIVMDEAIYTVDMTIDETGENLYFMQRPVYNAPSPNQLMKLNISSKTLTPIGSAVEGESLAGSTFCDATGRVFVIYDEDGFFEIDMTTGARKPISNAPMMASLNDGAMCPGATVSLLPTMTIGDASVNEGGDLVFPITLSNNTNPKSFTFKYQAFDGNDSNSKLNAKINVDFTASTFPSGVIQELAHDTTITIPTVQDIKAEADESLHLVLSEITGVLYHDSLAKGIIIDDDRPKTGSCYASTDNYNKLFIYDDLNETDGLAYPREVNLTEMVDGEGGSYRAIDGYMYVFSSNSVSGMDLKKINLESGQVTLVKEQVLPNLVDAAEFYYDEAEKSDVMYAVDKHEEAFYTVNTSDWSKTTKFIVGSEGQEVRIGALAINPYSGQIYGVQDFGGAPDSISDNPVLFTLDITGTEVVATKVFTLPHVDAEGLAFANDGNLYLETEEVGSGDDEHKIYRLNLVTQTLTKVAHTGTENLTATDTSEHTYVDIETLSCDGGIYQAPPIFEIITPEVMITEGSSLNSDSNPLVNADENVTIVIQSNRSIRAADYASGTGILLDEITIIEGTAKSVDDFISMEMDEADRTMLEGTDMLILSKPMIKADKLVETDESFEVSFSIVNQDFNKVTFENGKNTALVTIQDDDYNLLRAYDTSATAANPVIHTKIVYKPFTLSIVSLNPMGELATVVGDLNNTKVKIVSSSACVENVNDLNMSGFENFTITGQEVTKEFTISQAEKNMKVQFYWEDKDVKRTSCSEDTFSVRPKTYKIDVPSNLVAGKDFNITISALDTNNNIVANYEEDATVYALDINESKVVSGCTLGTIVKNMRNFKAGVSTVTIKYSDVGMLDFNVSETNTTVLEYAHIDADDAPYVNGSFSEERFIGSAIAQSTEIKPAKIELETTFTSDAEGDLVFFAGKSDKNSLLNETNITAAILYTKVTAQDISGNTVKNFSGACYATPVSVKANYTTSATAPAPTQTADTNLTFGTNEFTYEMKKELFTDGEGDKTVRVNFHRTRMNALNPMTMTLTDVNATTGEGSLSDVKTPADNTKTFIYVRAHVVSPQTNVGNDKNVSVDYEVYSETGFGTLPESGDSINWYIMDAPLNADLDYDELKTRALLGAYTTDKPSSSGPSLANSDKITLSHASNTKMEIIVPKLPAKNKILYTPKREHLKYNRHSETIDEQSFRINFLSDTQQWMGKGDLGATVDNVTSTGNGLQKMDW